MKRNLLKRGVRKIKRETQKYGEKLSNALMRRRGYVISLKKRNAKFYLPYFNIDLIQKHIYETNDYYEIDNLEIIFNLWGSGIIGKEVAGSNVIDVGTNIGNHTIYFLKECNASKVYCFEPAKEPRRILGRNVEINKLTNRVLIFDKAVGRNHGHAKIDYYDIQNIGGTTLGKDENGDIEVVALDEFNFDEIKLVKIDVEGFEMEVLSGMIELVSMNRPYIIVELRDSLLVEMNHLIKFWNYGAYVIKPFPQYGYADYLLYPNHNTND